MSEKTYMSTFGHVHNLTLRRRLTEKKMKNRKNLLVSDKPIPSKVKDD